MIPHGQHIILEIKGVFKGGGSTPPPRNFQIFWKSGGKEVERKTDGGGGLIQLNC